MPSFDIVSKTDSHELTNAVDQTNRELISRFDFKGTNSRVEQSKDNITLIAPTDFQLKQVEEIFSAKCAKRQIDLRSLEFKNAEINLSEAKKEVAVKQGLTTETAKKVVKLIKETSYKVQASIQGEQVRVTGKKLDDLQSVIAFLKTSKVDQPLQFENFRD